MLFSDAIYNKLNRQTEDKVVVLPHLPVSTDTDVVWQITLQAEKQLANDILLCPVLPFGSSHHHLSFGGTLSVFIATYTQLVIELAESLLQGGFRRIVLLNGHGGNVTPVKQTLAILSNKYDASLTPNIALVTYWELAGKIFSGAPPMESSALSHACEDETSLILHLFSEKVFADQIKRAKRPDSNGFILWEG